MSTKTRQILTDTHTDRGGGNVVLSDSLGALRSLRLSSSSLYLIWAEGWNLVIPPNEQKIVSRTHRDGEGLSSTLCCWHFCPCSGFRRRDKGELGDRESVQGHSHPSRLGGCVFLCLFFTGETTGRQRVQAANEGEARSPWLSAHCEGRCRYQSIHWNKLEECGVKANENDSPSHWKKCHTFS